jgi:hypothetical protein
MQTTFKTGTVIRFHSKMKNGEAVYDYQLSHDAERGEDRKGRQGTWFAGLGASQNAGAWAHIFVADEPGEWGIQKIEVIGENVLVFPNFNHGWMVRHPGYDLMY